MSSHFDLKLFPARENQDQQKGKDKKSLLAFDSKSQKWIVIDTENKKVSILGRQKIKYKTGGMGRSKRSLVSPTGKVSLVVSFPSGIYAGSINAMVGLGEGDKVK